MLLCLCLCYAVGSFASFCTRAGEFHFFGKKATFKNLRFLSKLDCMAGAVSFFRTKGEITRTRAHKWKNERRDFSPFRAFPSRAL